MSQTHQKLLRARLALALLEELHRRPTDEELQRMFCVVARALAPFQVTLLSRSPTPGGALAC